MSHLYQTQRPQLRPSGRIRLEDGSLKTTSPVNRINGDAVTAVLQGVEKCDGAVSETLPARASSSMASMTLMTCLIEFQPVIATIGESNQPISVLLDYAAGEKC
ncbi:hypothetical protein MJO29_015945 [Puccinia striiformis f. sp. tritici]|nr:hypothetical protein MJO29_015945 [Puccinia striiformis f. sp. tritici]